MVYTICTPKQIFIYNNNICILFIRNHWNLYSTTLSWLFYISVTPAGSLCIRLGFYLKNNLLLKFLKLNLYDIDYWLLFVTESYLGVSLVSWNSTCRFEVLLQNLYGFRGTSKYDMYVNVIYRVFIKYCVSPYNVVIFLNSASSAAAALLFDLS